MSKYVEMEFCELPETPYGFNKERFKEKDIKQIELYNKSKAPRRKKKLTWEEVTDETRSPNYARVVPKGCCFTVAVRAVSGLVDDPTGTPAPVIDVINSNLVINRVA